MDRLKYLTLAVAAASGVAAAPVYARSPYNENVKVEEVEAKVAMDTLTSRSVFLNLPLKNMEILSRSTRLDMLDYIDIDSIWKAPNAMEGLSYITKITPDYLNLQLTPVSTFTIKVLRPVGNPLAACVYTIGGEGRSADSQIMFFGTDVKELPASRFFRMPDLREFFTFPDKKTEKEILQLVPFPTVELRLSEDSPVLTARLTVGEYMLQEDYEKVKPYMKKEIRFDWNGKKYTLVK